MKADIIIKQMNYENLKHRKILKSCLSTWFSNPKELHLTDPRMSFPFRFNQWVKTSYKNKSTETWGAFSRNWMVGMCSLKKLSMEKQVHLYHVYIDKEHRRLGVGKKILKKILEQSKKTEANIITLNVVSGNTEAISLFEKMGFIPNETGEYMRLVKILKNSD